jgi:alpha-farnesene synthase
LIYEEEELVAQLELLDDIEHLGLGYHFEKEIKDVLSSISTNDSIKSLKEDLYATGLTFRLLRGHGFQISEGKNPMKSVNNTVSSLLI